MAQQSMAELQYAMQMRDVVSKLVIETLDRERPKYRYAIVNSIQRGSRKAVVTYNGETSPVTVSMGAIQPARVGQTVRIEGIKTDKYITDVIGDCYVGSADYNAFDNEGFNDPVKRAEYPLTSGDFYYESNPTFRRDGFHVTLSSPAQVPGAWRASPLLSRSLVIPGERWNYSFYIKRIGASTPAVLYFIFRNAAGADIGSTVTRTAVTSFPDNAWIRLTGAFSIPSGAVTVDVNLIHASTAPGGGYWLLDDVTISRFPENLYDVAGDSIKTWVADVTSVGHSNPPRGYVEMNGGAYSRTLYKELFANIGTQFGTGDGSTTFNVPNYNGKVLVGLDPADGSFNALTSTGGEKAHILSVAELATHAHTYDTNSGNAQFSVSGGTGMDIKGTNNATTSSVGSSAAHNNLQPYQVVRMALRASI